MNRQFSLCLTAVLISLSALLASPPSRAQNRDLCNELSGQPAIDACLRDIRSGQFSGRDLATRYNNLGTEYYLMRDYDRAIAEYTQAIRIFPNYTSPHDGRGSSYLQKGDLDRAIADYSEAIRINPKFANAYLNRGIAFERKKEVDRAIADYEAALSLDGSLNTARQALEQLRRR